MHRITAVLVLSASLTFFAGNVEAQTDNKRQTVRAETQTVQTRRVSVQPKKSTVPVIVATNKARSLPNWAQTGSSNTSNMSLAAAPKGTIKDLKLTVRNNFTPVANLSFRNAAVNSKENTASWNENISNVAYGYVTAGLNVQAGKRYLLNYDVQANQNMTFGINVGDTKQDITVSSGRQDLLVYLDATETAEVVALLNSDKARYVFYSLTVTLVD